MKYKKIRTLIAQGDLSSAIDLLVEEVENSNLSKKNEVLIQSSRLNQTLKSQRIGALSTPESNLILTQVSSGILSLIDELEKKENHLNITIEKNLEQKNKKKYEEYIIKKGFSEGTAKSYSRWINDLLKFFPQKDEFSIGITDLKEYCSTYLQKRKKLRSQSVGNAISAFKVFFNEVLDRKFDFSIIERPARESISTEPFTIEEMALIISNLSNLKHKAIVLLMYSCGLDASQVKLIRVSDINFQTKRMRIRTNVDSVEREAILSEFEIQIINKYLKQYLPSNFLFEGRKNKESYSVRAIQNIVKKAVRENKINKIASSRSLRYSYIKHFSNFGYSLKTILSNLKIYNERGVGFYCEMVTDKHEIIDKSPFELYTINQLSQFQIEGNISKPPASIENLSSLASIIAAADEFSKKMKMMYLGGLIDEMQISDAISSLKLHLDTVTLE